MFSFLQRQADRVFNVIGLNSIAPNVSAGNGHPALTVEKSDTTSRGVANANINIWRAGMLNAGEARDAFLKAPEGQFVGAFLKAIDSKGLNAELHSMMNGDHIDLKLQVPLNAKRTITAIIPDDMLSVADIKLYNMPVGASYNPDRDYDEANLLPAFAEEFRKLALLAHDMTDQKHVEILYFCGEWAHRDFRAHRAVINRPLGNRPGTLYETADPNVIMQAPKGHYFYISDDLRHASSGNAQYDDVMLMAVLEPSS